MSLREELKRLLGKTWASDTIHAELLEKKNKRDVYNRNFDVDIKYTGNGTCLFCLSK
ncbi:hypothetical protein [Melissococcus plutonius]|uniref:hypothetical protein n=1 Tax=Melissococcus plutonius TaxID=33970 RepID=UPI003C2EA036